ncbi:hypothetical protein, partial [Paractinoplanes brasiliensis]|uniref:hypothetical protein n=1 Tax=Paractinoplanes brasiliensis TaxID=52695 RepID=UPI0027DE68F9
MSSQLGKPVNHVKHSRQVIDGVILPLRLGPAGDQIPGGGAQIRVVHGRTGRAGGLGKPFHKSFHARNPDTGTRLILRRPAG